MHTLGAQIITAVFGALATGLLGVLVAAVRGIRRDVRTFMAEHMWLIATANWSRTSIQRIMTELGIAGDAPPDLTRPRK